MLGGKDKLKPCPFCGGKAILMDASYPYWIICDDCGARIHGNKGLGLGGIDASKEAWNRRTKKRRKEE